jgi:hypothetical protein
MPSCEWPGCSDTGTHTVTIDFPAEAREIWTVCRRHDRMLKTKAVASRPKASPPKEQPTTVEVHCGECRRPLDEPADLPSDHRQPCPNCGSATRLVKVAVHETLTLRGAVRVRSRGPAKGGWLVDTRTGDDYTRMLEGWGRRELTKDRKDNRYRELIELHDSTRIESTARLTDHRA